METNRKSHSLGKLFGGLLAAASEAAFEHCDDGKDAYDLTRLFLVEILKDNFPKDGNIERNQEHRWECGAGGYFGVDKSITRDQ